MKEHGELGRDQGIHRELDTRLTYYPSGDQESVMMRSLQEPRILHFRMVPLKAERLVPWGGINTLKILGRAGQVFTNSVVQRQKVECTQGVCTHIIYSRQLQLKSVVTQDNVQWFPIMVHQHSTSGRFGKLQNCLQHVFPRCISYLVVSDFMKLLLYLRSLLPILIDGHCWVYETKSHCNSALW